jgi:hypothetical protein
MNVNDPKIAAQLIAELLDANEQAIALLAGAVGDVVGRAALAKALDARVAKAQAAQSHPIRDGLLETAQKALRAK